jgi:hypothetical protein
VPADLVFLQHPTPEQPAAAPARDPMVMDVDVTHIVVTYGMPNGPGPNGKTAVDFHTSMNEKCYLCAKVGHTKDSHNGNVPHCNHCGCTGHHAQACTKKFCAYPIAAAPLSSAPHAPCPPKSMPLLMQANASVISAGRSIS